MYVSTKESALRLKQKAMYAVRKAVKVGRLAKLDGAIPCMDCGKPATCYDHRDYSRPLAVEPVCTGCNQRRGPGAPFRTSEPKKHESVFKVRFTNDERSKVDECASVKDVPPAVLLRAIVEEHLSAVRKSMSIIG